MTILPYGTLRESKYEAKRADVILVTKCPNSITEEKMNSKNVLKDLVLLMYTLQV